MITVAMKPGDLILVRSNALISRMIRYFGKCEWSHVAVYAGGDKIYDVDWGGVSEACVSKYQIPYYTSRVLDIKRSDDFRRIFLNNIKDRLGDGYDYSLLLSRLLYSLWRELKRAVRWGDASNRWTCVELVGVALEKAGEVFEKSPDLMVPDDFITHFEKDTVNG